MSCSHVLAWRKRAGWGACPPLARAAPLQPDLCSMGNVGGFSTVPQPAHGLGSPCPVPRRDHVLGTWARSFLCEMVMGFSQLSVPSLELSLIPWDGAGDMTCASNGWMLGRKKIPEDPISLKARPVYYCHTQVFASVSAKRGAWG